MNNIWLYAIIGVCALAIIYVAINFVRIKRMKEGTDKMIKMSAIIRDGANVFIKKEFATITIVIAVMAVLFSLFIEKFSGYLLALAF